MSTAIETTGTARKTTGTADALPQIALTGKDLDSMVGGSVSTLRKSTGSSAGGQTSGMIFLRFDFKLVGVKT